MSHWSDKYIGRQWRADSFNCGDLAILAQREIFGREIYVEGATQHSLRGLDRAIGHAMTAVERTDAPKDGDGVLLLCGSLRHVGIYCDMGEPHVLHNVNKAGVVRHRIRDLARFGYRLEGFYSWK